MSSNLRPRTVPEILDAAFRLLRENYGHFVLLSALGGFPYWAVLWFSGFYALSADPTRIAMGQFPTFGAGMGLGLAAAGIWWAIANASIVVAASDAFLTGEVVPGRALARAASRWWRVLGALILKGLAIFFGYFLILIGALWMATRYFASMPCVLIEDRPVVSAFNRSVELSNGAKWRILGGLVLAYLVYIVVSVTLSTIIGLFPIPLLLRAAFSGVVYVFVSPLIGIVITLLYYDMRIRKEAFDLEVMAAELGGAPPSVPGSPATASTGD
ncbi:MAG TPA: hypothetical protein VF041_08560 [Gemmatimonadaceae bacterium]